MLRLIQTPATVKTRKIRMNPEANRTAAANGLFFLCASGRRLPNPIYTKLPAKKDNANSMKTSVTAKRREANAPRTGAMASTKSITKEDLGEFPEFSMRANVLKPSQKS